MSLEFFFPVRKLRAFSWKKLRKKSEGKKKCNSKFFIPKFMKSQEYVWKLTNHYCVRSYKVYSTAKKFKQEFFPKVAHFSFVHMQCCTGLYFFATKLYHEAILRVMSETHLFLTAFDEQMSLRKR